MTPLREQLRVAAAPATLSCKKIAVGEEGGFATGVVAVHRALLLAGAQSLELHDPDPFAQARRRTQRRSTVTSVSGWSQAIN